MMVHREGRDAVAGLHTPFVESLGQFAGFSCHAGLACPFNTSICPARQNFAIAVLTRGIIDQVGNPQIPILHLSQHVVLIL